jgi:hypothetical protein
MRLEGLGKLKNLIPSSGTEPATFRIVAYNNNFVVWVVERTIPTERPPLVGEVSSNFLRIEGATWSA